jgi:hypothetical protein
VITSGNPYAPLYKLRRSAHKSGVRRFSFMLTSSLSGRVPTEAIRQRGGRCPYAPWRLFGFGVCCASRQKLPQLRQERLNLFPLESTPGVKPRAFRNRRSVFAISPRHGARNAPLQTARHANAASSARQPFQIVNTGFKTNCVMRLEALKYKNLPQTKTHKTLPRLKDNTRLAFDK